MYYDSFDKLSGFLLQPPDKQAEGKAEQMALVRKILTNFEPFCAKGQFLVGPKLCVCDFWVAGLACNIMCAPFWAGGPWDEIKKEFPAYCAYAMRFMAANKEYLESRAKSPF